MMSSCLKHLVVYLCRYTLTELQSCACGTHVSTNACTYIYRQMLKYTRPHVPYKHTHTYTYTHARTQAYTLTHMHTHTQHSHAHSHAKKRKESLIRTSAELCSGVVDW